MIKLFIDMDDTICHYKKAFLAEKERTGLEYPQSQLGFYRSLEPIKHAVDSIKRLGRYYDIWFLTRPSYKNAHCYTEKRLWIEDHFGIEMCEKLILCPDKSLIKGKGDYLIDDYPWPEFEGTQLQFGTDKYPTWFNVLVKLMSEYDKMKKS